MKTIELMVGDFVRQKYSNLLLEVSNINPPYIQAKGEGGQFEEGTIEPIPLTNEILEKNGFQYFHKNYAAQAYNSPFQLRHDKWPNEDGVSEWSLGLIPIKYVHELQHALRLCGIDIPINV